jgi:hypothetical protein
MKIFCQFLVVVVLAVEGLDFYVPLTPLLSPPLITSSLAPYLFVKAIYQSREISILIFNPICQDVHYGKPSNCLFITFFSYWFAHLISFNLVYFSLFFVPTLFKKVFEFRDNIQWSLEKKDKANLKSCQDLFYYYHYQWIIDYSSK